jgi:flagellin
MKLDSLLRGLSTATNELNKSTEKLSSGKRINRAADDAAGLAIVSQLVSDEKVQRQASSNIDYGKSVSEVQDAALSSISDISQRRAELAAQASNGTLSDSQRASLDAEYQSLGQEADRIVASTEFNGVNPLENEVNLQVGGNSSSDSQIALGSTPSSVLSGSGGSLLSASSAQAALDSAISKIADVSEARGTNGAAVSRLDYAQNAAESNATEKAAARSRIEDADIAETVARRVSSEIQQNQTTALLAQAQQLNRQNAAILLK